jgi:UDP-N-acetylglucosamine--N-acetylmuramyl-(pentapeptide) pyrophosphoryl-undecaprenol N-acetylglucosamine transferase
VSKTAPFFLIAAGGTGGHLLPALSLAKAIKRELPQAQFLFVGAGKAVEEKILAPENWNRTVLKTSGIKGRGLAAKVKALAECAAGVWAARKIIRANQPDLVIGAGGYVTVPVGIAAKLCGVPLLLHEQNSRPGLSNKVLAKMAKLVMLAFDEAAPAFTGVKTVVTGNPVRPEIEALANLPRDFSAEKARILVTGGSQGAKALNDVASKALSILHEKGKTFTVTHQTGEGDCGAITSFYAERGVENTTAAFFQDMAALYANTDLVIGRAGAATIAELAAAGLPSILVPLPTAADDHQTVNAKSLSERGAAKLLPQKDLSPEKLAETLAELLGDREQVKIMSSAARQAARLGADAEMARIAIKVMNGE